MRPESDIQRPGNGGVAGLAYWPDGRSAINSPAHSASALIAALQQPPPLWISL